MRLVGSFELKDIRKKMHSLEDWERSFHGVRTGEDL
jgi:hypothetical protein